jgi:hypothetical protein
MPFGWMSGLAPCRGGQRVISIILSTSEDEKPRYFFSLLRYCFRNFATLGAMTNVQ